MLCFRISYSSQLLEIFIKGGGKRKVLLQLERDIKPMHSSPFLELHSDVQPSLLHFFIFFIQLKNPNSSTTPSHERQEKYTPREKTQMKDNCFQMHHGKWKPRELPSLRKAVEVSSPKIPPAEAAKSEIFGHPGTFLQSEWNCSALCSWLELSTPTFPTPPSLHLSFTPVPFSFSSATFILLAPFPHRLPFHFSYSKNKKVLKCHFHHEKISKNPNVFKRENDPCKKKPRQGAVCHSSHYKPQKSQDLVCARLPVCMHAYSLLTVLTDCLTGK